MQSEARIVGNKVVVTAVYKTVMTEKQLLPVATMIQMFRIVSVVVKAHYARRGARWRYDES